MAKTVGMGVKPPETEENKKIAELEKENATLKKEIAKLKKQLKKEDTAPEEEQQKSQ